MHEGIKLDLMQRAAVASKICVTLCGWKVRDQRREMHLAFLRDAAAGSSEGRQGRKRARVGRDERGDGGGGGGRGRRRGRERATRNQRGVEFRGDIGRGEEESGRKSERESGDPGGRARGDRHPGGGGGGGRKGVRGNRGSPPYYI